MFTLIAFGFKGTDGKGFAARDIKKYSTKKVITAERD